MKLQVISIFIGFMLIFIHVFVILNLNKRNVFTSPVINHVFSVAIITILICFLSLLKLQLFYWLIFCVFAFGASAYLFVFGAIYKSLSLCFLLRIKKLGGSASLDNLDDSVTKNSFSERAKILCEMGLVIYENNKYNITNKGLRIAAMINRVRKIFKIDTIGLY